MALAAAKWVGSERERKRTGLLCLCGKQSPTDEKCWQGSMFWETCKNLLPVFYLGVLPWLLMERNETQKVGGGRQIRGWKKGGKQSQQPSIWEDLLLGLDCLSRCIYSTVKHLLGRQLPFRIKLHKGPHCRSIHLLWCNFPYISYQGR